MLGKSAPITYPERPFNFLSKKYLYNVLLQKITDATYNAMNNISTNDCNNCFERNIHINITPITMLIKLYQLGVVIFSLDILFL